MIPVFDRHGAVVAWMRGDGILDRAGNHCAFINGSHVFGYDGRYRGTFSRGFFRDRWGDAVAFVRGATGGPLLPLLRLVPVAPLPQLEPLKPIPPLPPLPPLATLGWSKLSWDAFIKR